MQQYIINRNHFAVFEIPLTTKSRSLKIKRSKAYLFMLNSISGLSLSTYVDNYDIL